MAESSLEIVNTRQWGLVDGKTTTWCPSGLLSLPPLADLTYGFWVSGWTHSSPSASIRLQTCGICISGGSKSEFATTMAYIVNLFEIGVRLEFEQHNMNDGHPEIGQDLQESSWSLVLTQECSRRGLEDLIRSFVVTSSVT